MRDVFIWYLTVQFLAVLWWPLVRRIFGRLPDQGWGLSKGFGLVFSSFLIWWLSSLHLVSFSFVSSWMIILLGGGLAWLFFRSRLYEFSNFLSKKNRWILFFIEELIFLIALIFWSWVRSYYPDIRGLEKFMDYGFVLSILRSPFSPPTDHFLSGYTINYYYFGHQMASVLIRLSGVRPSVGFNLQIALIFALTVLESFVLGLTLFSFASPYPSDSEQNDLSGNDPFPFLGVLSGGISAFLVSLAGNLHLASEFLAGRIDNYWYASASRVIPYTINEFPVYSFIVADLHGHVSDLPIVLLFLAGIILFFKELPQNFDQGSFWKSRFWKFFFSETEDGLLFVFLSFLLGVMFATNSWDWLIYLGLFGLTYFVRLWFQSQNLAQVLSAVILPFGLMVFLSVFLFLPYWLTVHPFSQGVGLVHSHSPLYLIFLLWGAFAVFSLIYLVWYLSVKRQDKSFILSRIQKLSFIFLFWSLILILVPEAVFIRDIYGTDYHRANTMFKFYYQAWIILAVANSLGIVLVGKWIMTSRLRLVKIIPLIIYLLIFIAIGAYPYVALDTNIQISQDQTLDGTAYMYQDFPDDMKAIEWLNSLEEKNSLVLLEAVGESYSDYARFCSLTGIPSVLGWPVHEWLWRGSWDIPGERQELVRQIYESVSLEETRALLEELSVDLIVVGEKEQESYDLSLEKFGLLGEKVFENGQTAIYKVF